MVSPSPWNFRDLLKNVMFDEILVHITLRACRFSEIRRFFLPVAFCLVKKTPNSGNMDRFWSVRTTFRPLMIALPLQTLFSMFLEIRLQNKNVI